MRMETYAHETPIGCDVLTKEYWSAIMKVSCRRYIRGNQSVQYGTGGTILMYSKLFLYAYVHETPKPDSDT